MADSTEKTTGSRLMNAFPSIAFVITVVMVIIVGLEIF